ncbi:hypothetical protein AvCA_47200 [Azotobacter vinelandii CA]|uniref:Zinc finger CGNR domain-containing protein n=2 Tax=Azotobacter vinelandii TaxID=354 RepID=C1DJ06_AZOVD|nr:ABATE domain-containing protein [Azotobacter vinelandii]ACO80825.1 Conserved hypothetical protein DUF1470 [Azotobacter vinelandii DJ]AGK15878.1 hypothetical protein AvCA_47200 [Azotobacter vinelandii CA]AGK22181.1 hypothetical protein AvCA6_47200 [Azotobacter vinelandii CA6]SFX02451.1 Conserved protein containing a Zn-ribbon-like motif, possibly RNA-binding [Azotobacter vinelandii]GLK60699.1 hypothetical protein GCM10017624_28610 [Azotobacter vinelandii]
MTAKPGDTPAEPYVLADHPVLDMLNTVARVDGVPHDFWQSDADVLRWLERLGMAAAGEAPSLPAGALLATARALREVVRDLVERRKNGEPGDPTELNRFLAQAASYRQVRWDGDAGPRLETVGERKSAAQFLAPLAERAAELLCEGDFSLIRVCEHPQCILWFYDRTKAHRRRWCSMALCGNRAKVAEFRKRKQK